MNCCAKSVISTRPAKTAFKLLGTGTLGPQEGNGSIGKVRASPSHIPVAEADAVKRNSITSLKRHSTSGRQKHGWWHSLLW